MQWLPARSMYTVLNIVVALVFTEHKKREPRDEQVEYRVLPPIMYSQLRVTGGKSALEVFTWPIGTRVFEESYPHAHSRVSGRAGR